MKQVEVEGFGENELEQVQVLKSYGYTVGEARMIVALAIHGESTMDELSKMANTPQSCVSVALKKLQEKNIVNMTTDIKNAHYYKRVELLIDPVELVDWQHGQKHQAQLKAIEQAKAHGQQYK